MMKVLILAAIYGTIVGGELVRAPYAVKTDAGTAVAASLDEATANALGYKLVVDEQPVCASNEYAVAVGWAETNRIWRVYEKRVAVPPPRKFSKLKIYAAISTLGGTRSVASETAPVDSAATWAKVRAWLEGKEIGGLNGWTAFELAQEISEDHPLFASLAEEARQLLGLSPSQFDALLSACVLES